MEEMTRGCGPRHDLDIATATGTVTYLEAPFHVRVSHPKNVFSALRYANVSDERMQRNPAAAVHAGWGLVPESLAHVFRQADILAGSTSVPRLDILTPDAQGVISASILWHAFRNR